MKIRYSVYRNLHNGKLSIKSSDGLVVGHCDSIVLSSVSFKVSKNGIDKIRREQKKYVVATVNGDIMQVEGFTPYKNRSLIVGDLFGYDDYKIDDFHNVVKFNPYVNDTFVDVFGSEVKNASMVMIEKSGMIKANV